MSQSAKTPLDSADAGVEGRHACPDETATIVNGRWICHCPKPPENVVYDVLDKKRNRWVRVKYKDMAQDIAERCNADGALAARAPFIVARITL